MIDILVTEFAFEDLDVYKELRVEMVRNHPDAFDLSLQSLLDRTDADWEQDAITCIDDPSRERYIARENEYPVGIIGCLGKSATTIEIGGLYVRPAYRGMGVGSLLLNYCVDFMYANGYSEAALWVSSANPRAKAWYNASGFEPTEPPTLKKWWDGSEITEEYLVCNQ